MSAQTAPQPVSRTARAAWRAASDVLDRHEAACTLCRSWWTCREHRRLYAIEQDAWTAYRATWAPAAERVS